MNVDESPKLPIQGNFCNILSKALQWQEACCLCAPEYSLQWLLQDVIQCPCSFPALLKLPAPGYHHVPVGGHLGHPLPGALPLLQLLVCVMQWKPQDALMALSPADLLLQLMGVQEQRVLHLRLVGLQQ